jgi:hypothetical protein
MSLFCIIDDWTVFPILISMEEQVISRAHRMGATQPIQVETLAMRGTIEEQMIKHLQVCLHRDAHNILVRICINCRLSTGFQCL